MVNDPTPDPAYRSGRAQDWQAPGLPASRSDCEALDAADPLAALRDRFVIPEGLIYLDGNSLGALPTDAAARVHDAIEKQWGQDLTGSWISAGWIELPQRLGVKLAPVIGARPDEVTVADSTSVNLFKLLAGALRMRPDRLLIVSETGNFPTDLYIAQGLIEQLGGRHRLELVVRDALPQILGRSRNAHERGIGELAVVMLTQVDYRTGSLLDMARVTADVHAAGALMLWDLAHSAGAFPVDLNGCGVDLAVGCGYKYLNGGPGAPAFLYVARDHLGEFTQPLSGWMGHAAPFGFEAAYRPADGVARLLCGTPPVLSMIALEAGLDTVLAAAPLGGLAELRRKSLALSRSFAHRALSLCADRGLVCVTPPSDAQRGSQVSFALPEADAAHAVIQALIARRVVGDFRGPDILRFGFAPLYLRHVDTWDAAEQLAEVLDTHEWDQPRFRQRATVT